MEVLSEVTGLPWAVTVESAVCVDLTVTMLSACVTVLVVTDVALTTEVLRTGLGV